MESILRDATSVCRFCLNNDGALHPITSILHSALTVENIDQFTGIQICEAENPHCVVCTDCHYKLESFSQYRSICINNDARFKACFPMLFDKATGDVCATDEFNIEYVCSDVEAQPSGQLDHSYCIDVHDKPTMEAYEDPEPIYEEYEELTQLCENPEQIIEYITPDDLTSTMKAETNNGTGESDADDLHQEEIDETNREDLHEHDFAAVEEAPHLVEISEQNHTTEYVAQTFQEKNVPKAKKPKPVKQIVERKSNKTSLCYMCGKLVYHLPDHLLAHTNGQPRFPCDRCPFVSSRKSNLKLHIENVHQKKVVRRCDKCDRNFSYVDSYHAHLRAKHNFGELLVCKICSMTFRHRSGLNGHINRKHNADSNCTCPVCGFVAQDKKGLSDHSRVHSNEKPFVCNYCPKAFKSPYARRSHQYIHEGIVFPCTACEKSYRYKSQLIDHKKKAHGQQSKKKGEKAS